VLDKWKLFLSQASISPLESCQWLPSDEIKHRFREAAGVQGAEFSRDL
jgi:hypothetical protein